MFSIEGKSIRIKFYLLSITTFVTLLFVLIDNYKNLADYIAPTILGNINYEQNLFKKSFYQKRISYLSEKFSDKPLKTNIIFIGDSYIQMLPNKALIQEASINLGISGQTTVGLANLLQNINWKINTKKLVVMIGYNDFKYRSQDKTLKNILQVIELLKSTYSIENKNIFILSLLPINKNRTFVNQEINYLNHILKSKVEVDGFNFIDTHSLFIEDIDNETYQYYMADRVHLNHNGYLRLANILNTELRDKK